MTACKRNLLEDFKRFQVAVHLVSNALYKHAANRKLADSKLSHRPPLLFSTIPPVVMKFRKVNNCLRLRVTGGSSSPWTMDA